MYWNANSDPASYATYWRHIVTAMRSVPGANFRFDWNPNIGVGDGGLALEKAWPGDAYVDYLGLDDLSDWSVVLPTTPTWPRGGILREHRPTAWLGGEASAKIYAVRLSIPEVGAVRHRSRTGTAGNDARVLSVEKMWQWVHTHDVAYVS